MINIGGYSFTNEKIIDLALTHSSFSAENYERLEFLGDSILDFLVAKILFNNTNLNEGMLTKVRSHYVSEDNLSLVFDNLQIKDIVKLGKSCKQVTKSIKCDILEAIIAAIYLDSNLEKCEKFINDNIFTENVENIEVLDNKSMLQEIAQSKKMQVVYTLLDQTGMAHKPTFVVEAKVGKYTAIASSGSKQMAEQKSAKIILEQMSKEKN
ncbi:MAG: ribonuclease III [Clostridia bacterium]|nr:ribonuclease III [Clostridia bacterium]